MLTGPQPKGAHQMRKITLDSFKELPKTGKSQILDFLLTGPQDPRYGLPIRNPVIDGILSIARRRAQYSVCMYVCM
jgi:hypothetical protein